MILARIGPLNQAGAFFIPGRYRYSPERKEAVLKKMMPPHNRSVTQLAIDEGISEATLYNWRQQARAKGILLPDGSIHQVSSPLSL